MITQEIASKIRGLSSTKKPILIGIEGFGGSGKSTLAEKLKQLLPNAKTIKIDAFILKEPAQNAEPWEQVFDRKRLEKQVLEPASHNQDVSYQRLEWAENTLSPSIELPKADYLIIDGISSYHPEIEHYYDFKIWVNAPIEVAKQRGHQRDSDNENAVLWDKWAQCDLDYQEKYHPEQKADFIVDNGEQQDEQTRFTK
jgi:uridine kinase